MNKKYLAKIIAKDSQGLKLISACCFQAKVSVSELRYLKKSQIFLVFLQRFNRENKKNGRTDSPARKENTEKKNLKINISKI